jgi:hypothetical protein
MKTENQNLISGRIQLLLVLISAIILPSALTQTTLSGYALLLTGALLLTAILIHRKNKN